MEKLITKLEHRAPAGQVIQFTAILVLYIFIIISILS